MQTHLLRVSLWRCMPRPAASLPLRHTSIHAVRMVSCPAVSEPPSSAWVARLYSILVRGPCPGAWCPAVPCNNSAAPAAPAALAPTPSAATQPLPYQLQLAKRVLEDFPSPYHTLTEGGHTPGEGADFLLGEVTDTVTRVRTEQGLLTYLSCLQALGGAPHLKSLKAITRLRLQSELYSLTSPGVCGGGGGGVNTPTHAVFWVKCSA